MASPFCTRVPRDAYAAIFSRFSELLPLLETPSPPLPPRPDLVLPNIPSSLVLEAGSSSYEASVGRCSTGSALVTRTRNTCANMNACTVQFTQPSNFLGANPALHVDLTFSGAGIKKANPSQMYGSLNFKSLVATSSFYAGAGIKKASPSQMYGSLNKPLVATSSFDAGLSYGDLYDLCLLLGVAEYDRQWCYDELYKLMYCKNPSGEGDTSDGKNPSGEEDKSAGACGGGDDDGGDDDGDDRERYLKMLRMLVDLCKESDIDLDKLEFHPLKLEFQHQWYIIHEERKSLKAASVLAKAGVESIVRQEELVIAELKKACELLDVLKRVKEILESCGKMCGIVCGFKGSDGSICNFDDQRVLHLLQQLLNAQKPGEVAVPSQKTPIQQMLSIVKKIDKYATFVRKYYPWLAGAAAYYTVGCSPSELLDLMRLRSIRNSEKHKKEVADYRADKKKKADEKAAGEPASDTRKNEESVAVVKKDEGSVAVAKKDEESVAVALKQESVADGMNRSAVPGGEIKQDDAGSWWSFWNRQKSVTVAEKQESVADSMNRSEDVAVPGGISKQETA